MLGTIVVRHERSRSYGAALKSDFRKALELGAGVIDALDVNFELHPYLVDELEYCFHAAFCIPTQFEAIEAAEVLSLLKSSSLGGKAGKAPPCFNSSFVRFFAADALEALQAPLKLLRQLSSRQLVEERCWSSRIATQHRLADSC